MQIASWLLLQRALVNGEMTVDQVTTEKGKIRLDTASARGELRAWNDLPDMFCDLVQRSLRLQARVQRMDADLTDDPAEERADRPADNPVTAQINLLRTAFGEH